MNNVGRIALFIGAAVIEVSVLWFAASHGNFALFNSKGMVAAQERQLMLTLFSLMIAIALPAVLLTFFTAWKFRSTNQKALYTPDKTHNRLWEIVWWAIPSTCVLIMSILLWQYTHRLNPNIPIQSDTKPLTVEVVALQWKWLFIYPQQHIATVNYLAFPVHTPLIFELTADAPMNSFWIPQLGGQMYAMTGMVNKLHLIANETGEFNGSDAEISGAGFAGMRFKAHSVTQSDFDKWVTSVKKSSKSLTLDVYNTLAKPSEDTPPTTYVLGDENLYNTIIMKFMGPTEQPAENKEMGTMKGM